MCVFTGERLQFKRIGTCHTPKKNEWSGSYHIIFTTIVKSSRKSMTKISNMIVTFKLFFFFFGLAKHPLEEQPTLRGPTDPKRSVGGRHWDTWRGKGSEGGGAVVGEDARGHVGREVLTGAWSPRCAKKCGGKYTTHRGGTDRPKRKQSSRSPVG